MTKLKTPHLVTISLLTTVTVLSWVILEVYNVLVKKPDVSVPPEILTPLDPQLNEAALRELQERVFYEEGEGEGFVIVSPTETASPSPTPEVEEEESTPSADLNEGN